MCCSFKDAFRHLCNTLADTATCKASDYVDLCDLEALNACRSIPLHMTPGVWPIGVCDIAKGSEENSS